MFTSELSLDIFCIILGCSVMISISIFPSLRRVSWKPIITLFLIGRVLDVGIRFLGNLRLRHPYCEGNPMVRELFLWLGFNYLSFFLYFLITILITLGIAWLIKISIGCKNTWLNIFGYSIAYGLIIGSFIAFISWLGVFL